MSDMEDNQPSTSGFSYLPEDVQLDILRMLPGDERKRHLAVVNKEWRALLTDGIAWPDLDLQPVSELSCSWLSTRAKGIRSLRAALVTLDQVKLFNQVLLEAQPALERLELHSHWYCTLHDSYHYVLGALLFTQLQEISFQSVAVDIRYLPTSLTSLHLRDCEVHGMASLARLVNLRELVVDVGMGSGTADFHPGRAGGDQILQLKSLRQLTLHSTPFGRQLFTQLTTLSALEDLTLITEHAHAPQLALPPSCALHVSASHGCSPTVTACTNLVSLQLSYLAKPTFDASILAGCGRLEELELAFGVDYGKVIGLHGLAKRLKVLKVECVRLSLCLPPMAALTDLIVKAFFELELVTSRPACAATCASLQSVCLSSLSFDTGILAFMFAARRAGLRLEFQPGPLRAVYTKDREQEAV